MSATNRGREKIAHEYYVTPAWCVHRLLEALPLPGGLWLEPAVGNGAIVRACGERPNTRWITCDIREEAKADLTCDFIAVCSAGHFEPRFTVAITNPPFSLAFPFVKDMRAISEYVIILQRLNWIGGPRAEWIRQNPCDVFVLPDRPSFAFGGSDSIEYAWFVWGPGHGGKWSMLADTPLAERKRK